MNTTGNGSSKRARQTEWRTRIPELRRIVEDVAPAMFEAAEARGAQNIPPAWRELVAEMQRDVHRQADESARKANAEDDATIEERRGYAWSWKVDRVAAMFDFLAATILRDIGFAGDESIASIVLLKKAFLYAQLELQDGATKDGRDDRDETRLRLLGALKALTPRFDDVHMLRFRAVQVAETCARMTRIPNDAEVAVGVEALRTLESIDLERHRDYVEHEQPVLAGLLARQWLAEVDETFHKLDPLVVLEEFAEAAPAGKGGKTQGGDASTGPVRALARLSVTCGALGYEQRNDETFDAAVDRARSNLLVTRSRLRKVMREFPGRAPDDAL